MSHGVDRIQKLEKQIQKGEHLRIQAQTKLEGLEAQKKETEDELKSLGVDPEKTQEEIVALEKEIEKELEEIEALLPSEDLESYKA